MHKLSGTSILRKQLEFC